MFTSGLDTNEIDNKHGINFPKTNQANLPATHDSSLPTTVNVGFPGVDNLNSLNLSKGSIPTTPFAKALAAKADPGKTIILALIDSAFLDMTQNFYETSILKHNISNYLFIASDDAACRSLWQSRQIDSCFVYMTNANANKASRYGTKEFNDKMNIRTYMILDALKLGYTVLHTDVDIVFYADPLNDIRQRCNKSCDMAILMDVHDYNAGFLYVRSTPGSISVYEHMKHTAQTTGKDDQRALNQAIKANREKSRVIQLPKDRYVCGRLFFQDRERYFADDSHPCTRCIVVHNNWIVTKEAKRYRFQEMHMWMYDARGYYSNPGCKYLTYNNPDPSKIKKQFDQTTALEINALRTAMYFGHVLNRTVILPRFHGHDRKECPMNSILNVARFANVFEWKFRESSFLTHPKVPLTVKNASKVGSIYWVKSQGSLNFYRTPPANVTIVDSSSKWPTRDAIVDWFAKDDSPVLRFMSFHATFGKKAIPENENAFGRRLSQAIVKGRYKQN